MVASLIKKPEESKVLSWNDEVDLVEMGIRRVESEKMNVEF